MFFENGGVAERIKAAVLKTAGLKGPVGSNPTSAAVTYASFVRERWPSGLRRSPAKRVYVSRVPWVQIPLSPLYAPMAQLDRAADYGSAGWGFESLWAR